MLHFVLQDTGYKRGCISLTSFYLDLLECLCSINHDRMLEMMLNDKLSEADRDPVSASRAGTGQPGPQRWDLVDILSIIMDPTPGQDNNYPVSRLPQTDSLDSIPLPLWMSVFLLASLKHITASLCVSLNKVVGPNQNSNLSFGSMYLLEVVKSTNSHKKSCFSDP